MALIYSYPYESNSSLARDVMEGKPSEIEYQNGTVIRMGRRYGVDARSIDSSIAASCRWSWPPGPKPIYREIIHMALQKRF